MVITIAITFIASLAFASPSVDFSATPSGTANLLLHSTGFMSTVKDHKTAHSDFVKNVKFGSSRTHSWAEADMNQRVVDLHHVFPLLHLDTTAASNYFFKATDRKLYYAASECGIDVMYRLGVSSESPGYNFTTRVPTNFTAVADAMSHIISHYSSAKFASGVDYSSTITRWEIWNAPDDWERNWYEADKSPAELRALFAQFFVTCLKKIRADHPSVKVGGPALSKWDPDYMDAILDACETEGVYPDFISYQCLTNEVDAVLSTPAQIRTWLDNRGAQYVDCEIILSAWHYVPGPDGIFDNLDMDDVHNACFGTDGTMTATAAAFNLAVLGGLQSTPLTRAYHAMTALRSPFSPYHWSSINTSVPHVAASVFQPFGEKLSSYAKVIPVTGNTGAVRAYAALSSDGATGCLAVANYKGGANAVQVSISGLSTMSDLSATVTDASHTNASVSATYSDGVLSLPAPDGASAAYFVTFSTSSAPTPTPIWPDCDPCNPEKKSTYDQADSKYSNQYERIHSGTLPKFFDVVTIGDSITDFWDDKDLSGYNSLSTNGADGVFNLGIGADNTQNVLWRLEEGGELENYTTRYFTLMIGGNNLSASPMPAVGELVAATERILYDLKTTHPEAKILMMPMLTHDRGNLSEADRKAGRQLIIDVNDGVMTNVDNKTIFWLDLRNGFPLTSTGTLDNSYWTPAETSSGTYVHPSAKAYQEIFDVRVAAAMAKYESVATGTAQATDPSIGFVFPPDSVFSNDFQVTGIYLGTDASAVPATTYDLYYQVDGAGGWTKVLSSQTRKTVSMSVPAVAAGSHTCQFKVVTSASKEALSAAVPFTVTSPVVVATYYKVGADPSDSANQNSWKKSCSSTVGWSSTLGGTVDSTHTVSSSYDYIISDGAVLRSPGHNDTGYQQSTLIPFAGQSLTVQTGGTLALQSWDTANKGVNIVSVPQLIGAGGVVAHYTSGHYKILKGGSITLNDGGLIFRLNGDRYLDVQSSVSGSGPIKIAGQATVGTQPYLYFTGDMSGFTGTIENSTDTDNMVGLKLRFTQPNFGGTVTSLPKYAARAVFNHTGLEVTGVRCIGTTIPDVLKTNLVLIGVANASAADLPLLSFTNTIPASASDFTVKYAATADDAGTAFADLAIIDGANNTQILVANHSATPSPTKIAVPTAVSGLVYNGNVQTGVAAGAGYGIVNNTATDVGNYTATASLTDPLTTEWSDSTTADKEIAWSIAKVTPTVTAPTMAGWTEGQTASEPAGSTVTPSVCGSATYAYYSDSGCTTSIDKPTTAGTYYVRGEVTGSANWNAANSSATSFTIASPVVVSTYYKVGADPDDGAGHHSWVKSYSSSVGWAESLGGTVISSHTVSSDYDYVIPNGTVLRSPAAKDTTKSPFAGKSLTVQTGGTLALQGWESGTVKGANTVSIPALIGEGGIVAHYTSGEAKILKGGTITLNAGGLIFRLNGDRYLDVQSSVSGSGPIKIAGQATVGTQPYLYFTGDMSGFTGTIENSTDTDNMVGLKLRFTQPNFGGTVTSLPKYAARAVFNHTGLEVTGVRCIGTTIPDVLKTNLVLIGVANASAADLPLLSFTNTISASASDFTVKYAATADDAGTAFADLAIIDGANNTQILVANHSATPSPTKIAVPTAVSGLVYNGNVQTGVVDGVGYTLTGNVATNAGDYVATATLQSDFVWNDDSTAAKQIAWSIAAPSGKPTYYMVGEDSGSKSSFEKSSSTDIGWAESVGGSVISTHTVASGNDYVIPAGSTLQPPPSYASATFKGDSLSLAGVFALKTYNAAPTVTITNLIAKGGTISHITAGKPFNLAGTCRIAGGDSLTFKFATNTSGTSTDIRTVSFGAELSGAGTIYLTGSGKTTNQTGLYLNGDASAFTGTIDCTGTEPPNFELRINDEFGGTITSLPSTLTGFCYKYEGANVNGIRLATTTIPEVLKTNLVIYSETANFTATNLRLIVFPQGTDVDPSEFTVKYATTAGDSGTAFTKLRIVNGENNTKVLVANYKSGFVIFLN